MNRIIHVDLTALRFIADNLGSLIEQGIKHQIKSDLSFNTTCFNVLHDLMMGFLSSTLIKQMSEVMKLMTYQTIYLYVELRRCFWFQVWLTLRGRQWNFCMKRMVAFLEISTSQLLRISRMRPTSSLSTKSAKVRKEITLFHEAHKTKSLDICTNIAHSYFSLAATRLE